MPRFGDRLGEILIDMGKLSEIELQKALAIQKTDGNGRRLGEILIEQGFITEEELGQALYLQTGYEYIQLANQEIDREALALVDKDFARRKIVMPVQKIDHQLVVAIGDPNDVTIIDDLRSQTGMKIKPRVSTPSEIKRKIETAYSQMRLRDPGVKEERIPPLTQVTDDMPVSQLIEVIINEALRREASDIHIEPLADQLQVRYRIDGVLQGVTRFSMDIHALTGHLVFSTLHTNSAVDAVPRLLNMGVEPYLLVAALRGVVSQRLVRKLCSNCKQPVQPEKWEQKIFADHLHGTVEPVETIYRPVGCPRCSNRGYRGRIGIFELFVIDEWTREMIVDGASDEEITREAIKGGMTTLIEDGLCKVISGITSLEEVLWHKGSSI
ncbi:MAG: GspE/PulE family protein [Candidatus Bipolaricaulia bacterium]